jgi:hypothetical protein
MGAGVGKKEKKGDRNGIAGPKKREKALPFP